MSLFVGMRNHVVLSLCREDDLPLYRISCCLRAVLPLMTLCHTIPTLVGRLVSYKVQIVGSVYVFFRVGGQGESDQHKLQIPKEQIKEILVVFYLPLYPQNLVQVFLTGDIQWMFIEWIINAWWQKGRQGSCDLFHFTCLSQHMP